MNSIAMTRTPLITYVALPSRFLQQGGTALRFALWATSQFAVSPVTDDSSDQAEAAKTTSQRTTHPHRRTARKAAAEEKLVGLLEMSAMREAYPLGLGGSGPYILCIRGSESATGPRRTYAVFFKNNDYVAARMSVIIDRSEEQAFTPLT
jgi:hypothetical protein